MSVLLCIFDVQSPVSGWNCIILIARSERSQAIGLKWKTTWRLKVRGKGWRVGRHFIIFCGVIVYLIKISSTSKSPLNNISIQLCHALLRLALWRIYLLQMKPTPSKLTEWPFNDFFWGGGFFFHNNFLAPVLELMWHGLCEFPKKVTAPYPTPKNRTKLFPLPGRFRNNAACVKKSV